MSRVVYGNLAPAREKLLLEGSQMGSEILDAHSATTRNVLCQTQIAH